MNWAKYNKLWVAFVGFAGSCVAQGLVDGTPAKWITAGIAFLTMLGVYQVPNKA